MKLKYIYQGTTQYSADLEFYQNQMGATKIWEFQAFGAHVAALQIGTEPLILLNDHSHETRYIYVVDSITKSLEELKTRGLTITGTTEIPTGTCHLFSSPSGQPFGLLEETRPDAMTVAYNQNNPRAKL